VVLAITSCSNTFELFKPKRYKNYMRKLFILSLISFITLSHSSCKRNTFYANKFGLIDATDDEINGVDEIPSFPVGTLPTQASLDMPPVGNQGQQGSCVAWACGYATIGYLMHKKNGTGYGSASNLFSPKYLYNQYAKGLDEGSSIPAILNLAVAKGDCTLADMPYNDAECSTQPTAAQHAAAAKYKISSWKLVNKNNLNVIKSCIVAKYPVVIAVQAYENLETLSYPYVWSSSGGQKKSGHALAVVGYDDNKNALKVQNSWGNGWGEQGFFWIDYNYFPTAVRAKECYIAFAN
jgi:C1A family cysteine protease